MVGSADLASPAAIEYASGDKITSNQLYLLSLNANTHSPVERGQYFKSPAEAEVVGCNRDSQATYSAGLIQVRLRSQANWASASAGFLKYCTRSTGEWVFMLRPRDIVECLGFYLRLYIRLLQGSLGQLRPEIHRLHPRNFFVFALEE